MALLVQIASILRRQPGPRSVHNSAQPVKIAKQSQKWGDRATRKQG